VVELLVVINMRVRGLIFLCFFSTFFINYGWTSGYGYVYNLYLDLYRVLFFKNELQWVYVLFLLGSLTSYTILFYSMSKKSLGWFVMYSLVLFLSFFFITQTGIFAPEIYLNWMFYLCILIHLVTIINLVKQK
jgi:hypothetical protein